LKFPVDLRRSHLQDLGHLLYHLGIGFQIFRNDIDFIRGSVMSQHPSFPIQQQSSIGRILSNPDPIIFRESTELASLEDLKLPKTKKDEKESHPGKNDEIDVTPFEVLHPFPGEGDNPLWRRANRRGVIRAVKKV
jgi:hypothetical protein